MLAAELEMFLAESMMLPEVDDIKLTATAARSRDVLVIPCPRTAMFLPGKSSGSALVISWTVSPTATVVGDMVCLA